MSTYIVNVTKHVDGYFAFGELKDGTRWDGLDENIVITLEVKEKNDIKFYHYGSFYSETIILKSNDFSTHETLKHPRLTKDEKAQLKEYRYGKIKDMMKDGSQKDKNIATLIYNLINSKMETNKYQSLDLDEIELRKIQEE